MVNRRIKDDNKVLQQGENQKDNKANYICRNQDASTIRGYHKNEEEGRTDGTCQGEFND